MRAVFGLVLVAGVGLAGGAAYMVQTFVGQQQDQIARMRALVQQQTPTVEVFAVARDLEYGEILTEEDVKPIRYAEPFLPEGVFTSLEDLFPPNQGPRTVIRQMQTNEPVLAIKVTEPGEVGSIAQVLTPGSRAFTIQVNDTSGFSGLLRPTDRVDVFWSGRGSTERGGLANGEVTKLIQSGLKIIAVDQATSPDYVASGRIRTVTLEASPDQVAALAQAQSTGSLSLALVGRGDDTPIGGVEIDQNTLLGIQEQEVVETPVEQVCTIRTRRGAEIIDIPVPCN